MEAHAGTFFSLMHFRKRNKKTLHKVAFGCIAGTKLETHVAVDPLLMGPPHGSAFCRRRGQCSVLWAVNSGYRASGVASPGAVLAGYVRHKEEPVTKQPASVKSTSMSPYSPNSHWPPVREKGKYVKQAGRGRELFASTAM